MISRLYLKEAKFEDFYSRPKPSFVDARMKNASKNCQLLTGSTPGSGKKSSSSDAAFSAGRTLTVNSESADKCDVLNGPDSPGAFPVRYVMPMCFCASYLLCEICVVVF